jgi:hypothetical protein
MRVLVAATLTVPGVFLASGPAAGGGGNVTVERNWHPFTNTPLVSSAILALDTKARTAYAFSQPRGGVAPLSVRAWDLDTLRPKTPLFTGAPTTPIASPTPVAVDTKNHDVVVSPAAQNGAVPTVTVVGERQGKIALLATATTRFPAGYQVAGMVADVAHNRLFLVGMPDAGARSLAFPGLGAVRVDAWKLDDLARGVVTSELVTAGTVPSACGQPITSNLPGGVVPSPDGRSIYFGCVGTTGLTTTAGPAGGEISGIAKMDVVVPTGATAAFRMFPIAGNFGLGDAIAAPGVPRIVLASTGSGRTNIKVFDTDHERYVGTVGLTGQLAGLTADPGSGVGYAVLTDGLSVFGLDQTPVSQGVILPEFSDILGSVSRAITVDPKTRRVFIPAAPNISDSADPYIVVVRDKTPVDTTVATTESRPLAEVPGKTDSTRASVASAAGFETRLVGGVNNVVLNATHFDPGGELHPGTRAATLGLISQVRLTNTEASAAAVTARIDEVTSSDAQRTAAPVLQCVDFSGVKDVKSADNVTVNCDLAAQRVVTTAAGSAPRILVADDKGTTPVPAAVQVRSASSSVISTRDPKTGATLTTVTSESDGVDILGVVQIGRVLATAKTLTQGVPAPAKSEYTRELSDVVVGGQRVCAASCSLSQVLGQINGALAGRVSIEFPAPVTTSSKYGSAAQVTVDPYQHVEDELFNDEPADSALAPAMVVTYFADGTAASRQITRLAALAVTQSYVVFPLGSDGGDGGGGGGGQTPPPIRTGGSSTPGTSTPGSTTTIPGTVTTANPPAQTGGGLVGAIVHGLRVVFRRPGDVAAIACIWMLLALPAYLAARRRLLLELPRLRRVQEGS